MDYILDMSSQRVSKSRIISFKFPQFSTYLTIKRLSRRNWIVIDCEICPEMIGMIGDSKKLRDLCLEKQLSQTTEKVKRRRLWCKPLSFYADPENVLYHKWLVAGQWGCSH